MTKLPAIERPRGLWMRLAYWISRRRFGKVLTPLKVIYARRPGLLMLATCMVRTLDKLELGRELHTLVRFAVANRNGCAFCSDTALAECVSEGLGTERFRALMAGDLSGFSSRERAGLGFAEEATRESPSQRAHMGSGARAAHRKGNRGADVARCRRELLQLAS